MILQQQTFLHYYHLQDFKYMLRYVLPANAIHVAF